MEWASGVSACSAPLYPTCLNRKTEEEKKKMMQVQVSQNYYNVTPLGTAGLSEGSECGVAGVSACTTPLWNRALTLEEVRGK